MAWVIGSFMVVLILGSTFLYFAALVRRMARSHLVIRRYDNEAYKEIRCPSCTMGAQYLGPNGWGPIPGHLRMITSESYYMGPPQANIRSCGNCAGNGWTTTRDPDVLVDYGLREIR